MLLYQVKYLMKPNHVIRFSNLFKQNNDIKYFRRLLHDDPRSKSFINSLKSRSLLKVSGQDSLDFLQGLITNDMNHFNVGANVLYALFLNNKSRILYDTLIYKWSDDTYLIECDTKVMAGLEKHLKLYKLKRKIQVTDMTGALKVWVLIGHQDYIPDESLDPNTSINIYKDPRLPDLGARIVGDANLDTDHICKAVVDVDEKSESEDGYRQLRYCLGVGEGVQDLFPGTMFPLEANCDYLHGISFHKGCYIGQELLARTHYTGVVRKRIMPLKLESAIVANNIPNNSPILDSAKKKEVGKLKGLLGLYGIGLLRIKEALEAQKLVIGDKIAETFKPSWWPAEAPKEKVTKTSS